MALSDAKIGMVALLAYETPQFQQQEILTPGDIDPAAGSMDFAIWSFDGKRIAEFRLPRALWDDFKAHGDATLAAFDEAMGAGGASG